MFPSLAKTTLLALAGAAILAGSGHADPLAAGQRARIVQGVNAGQRPAISVGELEALDRAQRGREFQQLQQLRREQDRQSNHGPLQLEVPVFQPSTPVNR